MSSARPGTWAARSTQPSGGALSPAAGRGGSGTTGAAGSGAAGAGAGSTGAGAGTGAGTGPGAFEPAQASVSRREPARSTRHRNRVRSITPTYPQRARMSARARLDPKGADVLAVLLVDEPAIEAVEAGVVLV